MFFLTILSLPPGLQSVRGKRSDDVLDAMAVGAIGQLVVELWRVAHKALLLLLVYETEGEEKVNRRWIPRIPQCRKLLQIRGNFLTTNVPQMKSLISPEIMQASHWFCF